MRPWEIHPALVHFPIAFLLGSVALDAFAWVRRRDDLAWVVYGLLVAGVATGWLTALAGLLAYFTVMAHTEEAHGLMIWHLALNVAMLALFTGVAIARRRHRAGPPPVGSRVVVLVAAVLLMIGGALGGYVVYHGGAGVLPELLAPAIRGGHSHGGEAGGPMPMQGGHQHQEETKPGS